MIYKIPAHPDCPVHDSVFEHPACSVTCILTSSIYPSSGERTECRLLWSTVYLLQTLLSNSQDSIYLALAICGLCLITYLPASTSGAWRAIPEHLRGVSRQGTIQIHVYLTLPYFATSDLGTCSQRQTMNHTVDLCPVTKLEGGLQSPHDAGDNAVFSAW